MTRTASSEHKNNFSSGEEDDDVMTKEDLIAGVADRIAASKSHASTAVNTVFELMKESRLEMG
jgi:hypothetical protein